MNKIFAPFLPPWVETGLQPAFYDMESGTVLQQTARMYAKVQQLTRLFNELSEETKTTVEEYIAKFDVLEGKFVELKEFVEDYFDNLDVQEEINNKLDAMAEDGTLGEIISYYLSESKVNMFFPNTGLYGDLTVIEFSKDTEKKYAIVDFGSYSADAYTSVTDKLIAKGITKFDYAFISHYHGDHVGMFGYFMNDSRFDFSECTFYLPPTVDWSLMTPANYEGSDQKYVLNNETNIINTLNTKGIAHTQPTNSTVINVNEDINITFLNCDPTKYSNYYDVLVDGHTNYNNFSVVMQINHLNKRALFTGDIEGPAQSVIIEQGLQVPSLLKINHHGVNYVTAQDQDYLHKYFKPEIGVIMTNRDDVSRVYTVNGVLFPIYVTKESGDITVTSNGSSLLADSEHGPLSKEFPIGNLAQVLNITGLMDLGGAMPVTAIEENEDLNDYKAYGTYKSVSGSITNTIANCPFKGAGFKLYVMHILNTGRYVQFIFKNGTSEMWFRYGDDVSWEFWSRYCNLGFVESLANGTDLNDLDIGNYCTMTGAATQSCLNVPSGVNSSFSLEVRRLNNYAVDGAKRLTQKLIPNNPVASMYIRNLTGDGWGSWYHFTGTEVS